ncbi:ATP-binding protein [Acinetobacter nosocomialis]|uniref:ATP-binding protein n=1 Tax=Acinetobacter nosocomialis TaxID=106654 RepID=UPI000B3DE457|nr:ATP-binding protein [Acinetobacter nosocomialis]MBD0445438.1 ATP-binding protein [Acinetobacter nosocomialis]MBP1493016.1 ATP-binding protein [Acinetobacter nosocomialis]MDQ9039989.1 ATP-binding protein [Acinetobacter nosocomialis]MDR9530992.1 ATP-binding protein [Acinetobacter nosocomialis]OUT25741.1 DNA replication protein [Acinetobacter nosocomialis P020]
MTVITKINHSFQSGLNTCSIHFEKKVKIAGLEICPTCAVNKVTESNLKHGKAVRKMIYENHLAGGMLPIRHKNSGFHNYRCELPGQVIAFNSCAAYAEQIMKGQVTNLVMVGKTGTGKTHLACATARTLLKNGKTARYITSEELANDIMGAWYRQGDSEKNTIYRYTEYDLLIIDEYGLHDREKRKEVVHKVLYARYDADKATMLISNFALNDTKDRMGAIIHGLISDLGDRLWSRFQHGGLTQVECVWADTRLGARI